MRRSLLLIIFVFSTIFFLVSSFSVFSQSQNDTNGSIGKLEIKIISSENIITANGVANFELSIKNNFENDLDFFIAKNFYSNKWRMTAEPYLLSIGSGLSRNTRVNIYPVSFLTPSKYDILLTIESRDKKVFEEFPLNIEIIPFGEENVVTELVVENNIDPRLGSVARVNLENLFNYDIDNVTIILESELFSFERNVNLAANEKKIENFELFFDDDVELKDYEIDVVVRQESNVLGTANEKIILAPYSEVTEKIFRSNTFNRRILISKENTGKDFSEEKVSLELTAIEKVLARYNINPGSVEKAGSGYIARWEFSLDPEERKEIVVTIPYGTYLSLLLVIVLLLYIILHITKRKVVIVKRIVDVSKDKEGIRGIKIILHLTNKGNKAIEKIRVIDYLPKLIAASGKDFGTMRPSKVQRSLDGRMRLVWELDGLDRGEERIISYIAKSRLSIIGKMLLPEAVVECKIGRKNVHIRSNKLTLLTKASDEERKS